MPLALRIQPREVWGVPSEPACLTFNSCNTHRHSCHAFQRSFQLRNPKADGSEAPKIFTFDQASDLQKLLSMAACMPMSHAET